MDTQFLGVTKTHQTFSRSFALNPGELHSGLQTHASTISRLWRFGVAGASWIQAQCDFNFAVCQKRSYFVLHVFQGQVMMLDIIGAYAVRCQNDWPISPPANEEGGAHAACSRGPADELDSCSRRLFRGAVEGLNNKLRVVTIRSYGLRTYDGMKIAMYHTLGQLPEPETAHDFC